MGPSVGAIRGLRYRLRSGPLRFAAPSLQTSSRFASLSRRTPSPSVEPSQPSCRCPVHSWRVWHPSPRSECPGRGRERPGSPVGCVKRTVNGNPASRCVSRTLRGKLRRQAIGPRSNTRDSPVRPVAVGRFFGRLPQRRPFRARFFEPRGRTCRSGSKTPLARKGPLYTRRQPRQATCGVPRASCNSELG